jgi:hypothetical protein
MSFIHRLLTTFDSVEREPNLFALHAGEPAADATKRRKPTAKKR